MSIILAENRQNTTRMQRDAYAGTLDDIMAKDTRVVALDADLASSVNMAGVMQNHPAQSVNCGIAEANMVCIAAGLSTTGKIPFAHTFGAFASRRVCDQVFMSACYAGANVRIVGSDPGIGASFNGGTHMPFTDMAILGTMPGITLLEPADYTMTEDLVRQLVELRGVFYLRLYRKHAPDIYAAGSRFEIGRAVQLREGRDVTIIASGLMVDTALEAARQLAGRGIQARVLDMFTWKPLDKAAIMAAVAETGCIVTAENHSVVGGLGSAVAALLATHRPTPLEMVGVQDLFGEVGTEEWLRGRFGLQAQDICAAAQRAVQRK